MHYDTFGTCNGFASSLRSSRCRFKPPVLSLAKLSARKKSHTHTHVHSLRVLHRTLHICPDINVCLLDAHGLLLVMRNRAAMAVAKRLGSDAAPEPKSAFSTLMQRLLHSTCNKAAEWCFSPLAEISPEADLCHEHLHRQRARDIPRQIVPASVVLCINSCPSCGKPRLFEHASCRTGSLSVETAIRRHFDTKAGG